jgi:hypothetical protein
MATTFIETFDQPSSGWVARDAERGLVPVEVRDGAAVSRGPWWVDPNHAPPGAGYLHILFAMHTHFWPEWKAAFDKWGVNGFIAGGYPTDFRNARITCRLKGRLEARGARLTLLAQAKLKSSGLWVNQALATQSLVVTPDWSEQTLTLTPDQRAWTQLGNRHDTTGFYGPGPINELLGDLNGDILFVLFPLDVRPVEPFHGDPHILRPDEDYKADRRFLPEGEVFMDEVRIELAD